MTKEEYRAKKIEEFDNLQINTCPEAFQESERKNIAKNFLSQTIDELWVDYPVKDTDTAEEEDFWKS